MPSSSVGLMAVAALLGGLVCARAVGAPIGHSLALRAAGDAQNPIQEVQYYWNGYNYCWYDYGWRGPGWYVCDYGPWVTGYWWGGPLGWNNWRVGRFEGRRRVGRAFGPGPGRQFTGPSTQGRTFANGSGPNRPRPGAVIVPGGGPGGVGGPGGRGGGEGGGGEGRGGGGGRM
jgi:hypothetical protein